MSITKLGVAVFTVMLGSVFLAGCSSSTPSAGPSAGGDSWNSIVAKADEEGSVVLYTGDEDAIPYLVPAFEKAYPKIKLTVFFVSTGPMEAQLEPEFTAKKGDADVFAPADEGFAQTYADDGDLQQIVAPELKDSAWDSYAFGKSASAGEATNSAPTYFVLNKVTPLGLGWNTKLVPNGLTSFCQLAQPRFKNDIFVRDVSSVGTIPYYQAIAKVCGASFFADLAKQHPVISDTPVTGTNDVISGELAASIQAYSAWTIEAAKGAPIKWIVPSDVRVGSPEVMGIPDFAPHPAAAQVLVNFMMTDAGQTAWAKNDVSILANIPDTQGEASQYQLINTALLSQEEIQSYTDTFNKLFGLSQ
jgi:iron(III) transport system substrate-binding protein